MAANYVFLGTPGKKGFQQNNQHIIEAITVVLKERDPKVSMNDVVLEFKHYFKYIVQQSKREMSKTLTN